jgi:hypothetical protein
MEPKTSQPSKKKEEEEEARHKTKINTGTKHHAQKINK